MPDVNKAVQTQLENIQKRSGKTLKQLYAILGCVPSPVEIA